SSRRRHTRFSRDWSSDVCSSDLLKEFDFRDASHLVADPIGEGRANLGSELDQMPKRALPLRKLLSVYTDVHVRNTKILRHAHARHREHGRKLFGELGLQDVGDLTLKKLGDTLSPDTHFECK